MDVATIQRLGLGRSGKHLQDAPGGKVESVAVNNLHRTIGGIPLEETSMQALDPAGLAPLFGHAIDGILGYDFFQQYAVKLDYGNKCITLYDPMVGRQYKGQEVAIDLKSRQPYINASIGTASGATVKTMLELDTGKVDPFSLNAQFARNRDLITNDSSLLEIKGISLGGQTDGWLTRTSFLRFGGFTLNQPVTGIVEENAERAGQIGSEVLSRFTITFDYSHSRIFLAPNSTLESPIEFDHAGLILAADGKHFQALKAFLVIAGTPAAKAGLRDGDEILTINKLVMTLDAARAFLAHAEGSQEFRVRRQGQILTIAVDCHRFV